MSSQKAVNQCEGAGLHYGACLNWEVTSLTDDRAGCFDFPGVYGLKDMFLRYGFRYKVLIQISNQ